MVLRMASATTSFQIAEFTLVSLKTASNMAMGLRKDFIKKVTGHRRMEWLNINFRGTTVKDLNTAMGKRLGLMAHSTLAIILTARKTGRAQELRKTGQSTPGSFFVEKLTVRER
jgi:hypothetical protein